MSWKNIRGHETQIRSFQNILQRDRLSHAYLFVGPQGIGKQLFARELARTVLCEGKKENEEERYLQGACEHCPSCAQVDGGTHPDFVYAIRPEESHEFPIALMRDVCARFSLKPFRGGRKVILLDDADDLNEESANCFLKTLEEPPAGSLVILISHSLDRQLSTIRSRCQVVRFSPLEDSTIREIVQSKINDSGEPIEPNLLNRLIRLSAGSPGQALALMDSTLWKFRSTFVQGLTRRSTDPVALAREVMECVEEAGKESALQRNRARLLIRLTIDLFSNVLAIHQHQESHRVDPEDRPILDHLINKTSTDTTLEILDRCLEADRHIERRVQLILAIEAWLDRLAAILNEFTNLASQSVRPSPVSRTFESQRNG